MEQGVRYIDPCKRLSSAMPGCSATRKLALELRLMCSIEAESPMLSSRKTGCKRALDYSRQSAPERSDERQNRIHIDLRLLISGSTLG